MPVVPTWSVISISLIGEMKQKDIICSECCGRERWQCAAESRFFLLSFNCVLRKQSPLALKEDDGKLPC